MISRVKFLISIIIKDIKSGERLLALIKRGNSYLYCSLRVRE